MSGSGAKRCSPGSSGRSSSRSRTTPSGKKKAISVYSISSFCNPFPSFFRLQTLEQEYASLEQDSHNLREQIERLRLEKKTTEDFLIEAQQSLAQLQEEHAKLTEAEAKQKEDFEAERLASKQLIHDLNKEVRFCCLAK